MDVKGITYVIIVASGSGSRFGSELPKQFCQLNGAPLLMTTISRIKASLPADSVILLAINKDHEKLWKELCEKHGFNSPAYYYGGATRWASVKNVIDHLSPGEDDVIMVHDGARPVIFPEMMERISAMSRLHDGVIPAAKISDSLRIISDDGASSRPIDRNTVRAVQTPQAFKAPLLKKAYELPYRDTFTDDASVMSAAGFDDIILVDGDTRNIKVTMPDDIKIASLYLEP